MTRMREPSSINIVSIILFLMFFGMIYGGWKYIPVYWQRNAMQEMMQGVAMSANRAGNEAIQATILTRLTKEFNMTLSAEDVQVTRTADNDWIDVVVTYPVVVHHPLNKDHAFVLTASIRRRIIDL